MSLPILTPIVLLTHEFADPGLCAWRDGGANTLWMGDAVVTQGPPAIIAGAATPQERSNNWGQTLVSFDAAGAAQAKLMFNTPDDIPLPSDFGSDTRSRPAMAAATWFMGCTQKDDPNWPAIWDLAPHLLTPYPYLASEGMPLAFTQEAKHSPVPEARRLAGAADIDDSIQPWFVIGWEAMSAHERLRARAGFEASIRLHAKVNLWDRVYEIAPPVIAP